MSREPRRATARGWCVTGALLLVGLALGCGPGDANGGKRAGRASTDSVARATDNQAESGATALPTPGFTSARGTPAAQPSPAIAPTTVAARMAPPPPTVLASAARIGELAAIRALPAGPGHDLVIGNCLSCHSATIITQQHKDTAGWNKTVTAMVAWGAQVPKDRSSALVAYLAEHYPARAAGPPARQGP